MQAGIRIRRAVDDDALALSLLAERTFCDAFADSNTAENMRLHCASTYGQALQLAEIRAPGCETWVAEAGNRLLAYVQLRLNAVSSVILDERPVEIQRFYVDGAHHGTGLAHHLIGAWEGALWRSRLAETTQPLEMFAEHTLAPVLMAAQP